ncbi:MAG: response regulator transcription factor [Bacteroidales bacterium]
MNNRILVVEDEQDLQEILRFNLRSEGYIVDVASSGEEAAGLDLGLYDLFILDVMMGRMSGFQLADHIRNNLAIMSPVIFLTAKADENDLLTGFSLGADDYIRKPFSIVEVKARVRAVLKRTGESESGEDIFTIGEVKVDFKTKAVTVGGKAVELTRKEYDIFVMLIRNNNRFITREEILSELWAETLVTDRTVDVHIARLRKRLGKFGEKIRSRTGYGYFLDIK